MEDKQLIRDCRIEFESGVERNTSIRFFVERALEDDEATVYDGNTDEKVTNITEVEVADEEVAA